MKRQTSVLSLLLASVAAIVVSTAFASNGIQRYEFSWNNPSFYVACLGEDLNLDVSVSGTTHAFETPSGTFHLIDGWKETWMFTGNLTGRTWIARDSAPWQVNIGPGQTEQWVQNFVAHPLTGDGPKFRLHGKYKVTVNANGDLVVHWDLWEEKDPSEFFECIGKK